MMMVGKEQWTVTAGRPLDEWVDRPDAVLVPNFHLERASLRVVCLAMVIVNQFVSLDASHEPCRQFVRSS